MTPRRLRAMPEDRDRIYAEPHDHRAYGRGHGERVDATVAMVERLRPIASVADLSCGNAVIPRAAQAAHTYLGDYAPGYQFTGPIEETIGQIPVVDLFTCCETLEHLEDPLAVLRAIRGKCRSLILSTPIDNWDDGNGEHLWAWSRADVEELLRKAAFTVLEFDGSVDSRAYDEPYWYGIWLAT